MHLSGLVVVFNADFSAIQSSLIAVKDAGPFTLGELLGRHLSLLMELEAAQDAPRWLNWLRELPGVADVSIAYCSVEAPTETIDA